MSLVVLNDVVKTFDEVRAVDGVSFSIDRGEVVGFLGPNGAGKTTTMRLITQILEPDSGSIEIDGRTLEQGHRDLRARIGYLPETNPLYTDMLVSEYLDFVGRLRGMSGAERKRRLDDVVPQMGIPEVYYRPIDQLSKGYRQRVGLAQAILSEPEILIFDEPTEGLDPNQRVGIRALIRQLGEERTVLLSTHVMGEVRHTCDRVVIISQGRIVADDSVESLVESAHRGTRVLVDLEAPGADVREAMERLDTVAVVEETDLQADLSPGRGRWMVTGSPGADPRLEIFRLAADRGWGLWDLHLQRESLEDLFHELTVSDPKEGVVEGDER